MEPVGKSCSLLIILTTLLSETWGAPDKELLCGGKILKCYYDQILDIHFFTFSHTIGVSKISCQISIYYEQQNSCFFNLSFREFTAAINFPCSKSGLRIGENDVIFSKIPHGLKL